MATALKELKIKGREAEDPRKARARKHQADETKAKAIVAEKKANDPISEPIKFGEFYADVVPTQIWGRRVIDDFAPNIPRYRFKRWYLGQNIIVDHFMTEKAYNEGDVAGRRALCEKYGFRYAALGPNHSVKPYENEKLRAKYPSLMEQLGMV